MIEMQRPVGNVATQNYLEINNDFAHISFCRISPMAKI